MTTRHAEIRWTDTDGEGRDMCAGDWPAGTDDDEVLMCMERLMGEQGADMPDGTRVVWTAPGAVCSCGHREEE